MERLIIACIQQRMRIPQTIDEYQDDLRRFMRIAEKKNARLVVFPELAGLMIVPPLLRDFRSSLLIKSNLANRSSATIWQKLARPFYAGTASVLGADFPRSVAALLDAAAADIDAVYTEIYGGIAREFGVTVVAPSAYLPDKLDNVVRNLCGVFGPNGEQLGYQGKIMVHANDEGFAQPSKTWDVIPTEVGRLGIMLGGDVMYPEVGRLLAYQGAEILISMAACAETVMYNKVRAGMLARMQDNQLFGVSSFLVGDNSLFGRFDTPFVGKSVIFAPQELTPKLNGVLVEMGNHRSEGVITAEWNFAELQSLWESSNTPVRKTVPLEQTKKALTDLYEKLKKLPRLMDISEQSEEDINPMHTLPDEEPTVLPITDLPVLSSVTARWPLHSQADLSELPIEEYADVLEIESILAQDVLSSGSRPDLDEETEEMDALNGGDLQTHL